MTLPIDRTNKSALDTNLVNGVTSDAPKLKNNNDTVYNTIDELNTKVDTHASAATLAHPDASVTTAKIADAAVTTAKIAAQAVTIDKLDPSLQNSTNLEVVAARVGVDGASYTSLENRLNNEIGILSGNVNGLIINAKYPPAPLVPCKGDGVTDDYNSIIAILGYMNYKGILFFPVSNKYIISEPIHLGITSADDAVNTFLVDGLTVLGAGTSQSIIKKTTTTLDKSGTDSIFYTNAINTHICNIGTEGLGYNTTTISFNLRSFSVFSSIEKVQSNNCKTGIYLDSVWSVKIDEYHVGSAKMVFDSSSTQKTSVTIDNVWGENIFKFGLFQSMNYCHFGTLHCDWANISAPTNTYPVPVTFTEAILGLFEFELCTGITIDVLACEHANAQSFLYYGASSLNISTIDAIFFDNTTGTKMDASTYIPIVALNKSQGVKKCNIENIELNNSTNVNLMIWYPYASSSYGSKYEHYLSVTNMSYDAGVVPLDSIALNSNVDIMVKHPRGKYPIYWDKPIPDSTALPYFLKVAVGGVVSSEAVTYYYFP